MRVTKIIREYVEKNVKAIPKFAEPTPEEIAYTEFQKKISEFAESVENEMRSAIQEAIDNFRMVHNIGEDVDLKPYDYNMVRYSTMHCNLACKANTAKQERNKACREAIDSILVALELGADKSELDEMLKKLAE